MISGSLFFVGIILFVVLWVAVSYRVFLSQEPDLAVDEDGLFDPSPTGNYEEGASAETTAESPPEQEPVRASSFSSEPQVEPQVDDEVAKSVPKKAVPRNAMSVKKKAKRPKRKN